MKGQRALVTGATGFVGKYLVRQLVQTGWQVHAIVRPDSDRSVLDHLEGAIAFHEHAGTTDSMLSLFNAAKPDVVFHLASLFLSDHQPSDIERLVQSNLLFGLQVVEAMQHNDVSALVNTGTSWKHYNNCDYSPVNLYAATKQAFESLLQYYIEAHGLRVITLDLFDTYGPGDLRPKLINLLRRVTEEGQSLAMSPGDQMVDFVHVNDVVRAFLIASERLQNGDVSGHEHYAVSSGEALSLRELVAKVQQISGQTLPVEFGGRPYRTREVFRLWQGSPLPTWQPKISLSAGLEELFAPNARD